ncbi:MAG: hypothetical protein HYV15_07775 [Elusimicrobia bacterium]|nr:hypothetical protein [Elusimicrobiota bacterium]
MSERGEFKEAGSFRVDRERALEKLALFAMPRGEMFLLPLLRCAVAAGAKALALGKKARGLELRFDGEPFARAALADPYGALLNEDGARAARHLAVGLLTAFRTRPSRIVVESGADAERLRLCALSVREEALEPAPRGTHDTLIRVEWPLWRGWKAARAALAAARGAAPLVPRGFYIEGASLKPAAPDWPEHGDFAAGGARGTLRLPAAGAAKSSVTFCQDGVAVETVETWLPWAQVDAWVEDPGLRLNASQSGVVEDESRRAALDAVAAASKEFLLEAARDLAKARPPGAGAGSDWGRFARAKDWLREACGRLLVKDPGADGDDPLLRALWDAPVLLDVCYRPLTLAELHAADPGGAAWSRSACPGNHPPGRIAWCPDAGSRALLKARFGAGQRDMSKLIESLSRTT